MGGESISGPWLDSGDHPPFAWQWLAAEVLHSPPGPGGEAMAIDDRIVRLASRLAATPVRKLGEGGMGEVYLLRIDATGELLALKVMVPASAADPTAQALFQREAANCLALHHPN